MQFLIVAQLLDDPRIIRKRDDGVNTVPRIRPGFNGRNSLGKYFIVQVFIFFMPSFRLLRRAFIAGARLALVRQKAERPCDRGAVARQTENDWRLLGTVEGYEEVPPRVVDNLSKFMRRLLGTTTTSGVKA